MYIGNIGEKLTVKATYLKSFSFTTYYGKTQVHKFADEQGNILVWKTSKCVEWIKDGYYEYIPEGSVVEIKCSVKDHNEYKGEEQTIILRCKFTLIEKAKTKQEKQEEKRDKQEEKRDKQIASLQDGDQIITMTYKNYKEHYADCETVAGSFSKDNGRATIDVIVRAGRMVASGVRGQRFSTYVLQNKNTKMKMCFYAVCEENAFKQAKNEKGFNTNEWECVQVFNGR